MQANIQKYQVELKEKISEVDEEICDIMHFVELYERDDEQSLELMDKIFDCRKRRRKVKDELFRAETFAKIFAAGGIANLLKDVNRQMENMDMREYIPRRLHSLFVQGVKLEEHEEESFINEDLEYDKEEQAMDYERHDTIFDGKENDWQSVVGQQAELFENIEQYAVNLELDMEELSNQIEELMITCEDANCNVAQGYKMFKQLKELRLTRKEKAAELDRVSAMIECFDCSAMADTYRYLVNQFDGKTEKEIKVLTIEDDADEEVREAI